MTRADRIALNCVGGLYLLITLYGLAMSIIDERWGFGCIAVGGLAFWTWQIWDVNWK